ncbi:hypothetical protein A2954_01255 [Candidatus Roizmanbacteria bacterium RIFCSPLOWO2_01_FULL_37_12]|uniref:DUF4258 domain-containing protein n=1 Tax=Candidatus Roizmanbacteria bacterium RIFCSPLOWO2_01_FULL_37_12 TaxID=1802056 RepID=A0A1F7IGG3_9BACT|nr:MAG: hypothetical protein A3D76_06035 [Candidatus Roizmanbacteria bacterium RIFCSPHIGHO2_02_FULL_37_9b]OGK42452.1 MAG: hypothetical protein A2954_01255 [Candidatus Roizmanbacteria bacterium RIFCSPLOWO2_01_FULL_37_12]
MKIIYTKHAEEKLGTKEAKKFRITKSKIEIITKKPITQENLATGLVRAFGLVDEFRSLCIVYKKENGKIKIITFFPAEKGRYENKILS